MARSTTGWRRSKRPTSPGTKATSPATSGPRLLKQKGATLWFTGLCGSGKSTIAFTLEHALVQRGRLAYVLDGDNIRHGLNKNLGFSAADREENIRRIGEVAKLFADAGVLTLTSFISPYRKDRDLVRALHADGKLPFIEVHLAHADRDVRAARPQGALQEGPRPAMLGKGMGFTGVDDPYEAPLQPEITHRRHGHVAAGGGGAADGVPGKAGIARQLIA